MATEFDWLYDYIAAFLKSPPWTVPLNTFIDENCIIFDSEDENKLSYTECHNKFIKLIEDLLERSLKDIGITEEQFLLACSKGASTEVNKLIFGQILAVDDFLTFKKMMVKRNMELEVEAMRALQKVDFSSARAAAKAASGAATIASPPTGATSPTPSAPPSATGTTAELLPRDRSDADAQLELALRLSAELAKAAAATTATPPVATTAPAATGGEHKAATDVKPRTDAEFETAVRASVMDHDIYESEFKREQAEMEHAIALSLALEADRVRQMEAEEKAAHDALEASARDAAEAAAAIAAAAAKASAEAAAAAAKVVIQPVVVVEEKKAAAPAAAPVEVVPVAVTPAATPAAAATPSPSVAPRKLLGDLPPLGSTNKHVALAALTVNRAHADEVFRLNQETLKKQKEDSAKVMQVAKVDDAELARRQAFLRAQRELLLAKKNKERNEELTKFNAERKGDSTATAETAAKIEEEKKKLSHREELAGRIKADMIASERRRLAEAAAGKNAQLSEQMRAAERLREEKNRKAAQDAATQAAQERERQSAIAALHKNVQDGAHTDFHM